MIWRMEATHLLKCLGQLRFRLLCAWAGGCDAHPLARSSQLLWFCSPSKPLFKALLRHVGSRESRSYAQSSRGFGRCPTAKKLSATCWSALEAAQKPKPLTTPVGSVATSKPKPSYHPRLLDHPMSARPASHPSPRRFASLKGASPSSVESLGYGHLWVSISCPPGARLSPR
jgi:hypothetical protein